MNIPDLLWPDLLAAKRFAKKTGQFDSFRKCLISIASIGRNCGTDSELFGDFAPYSFCWRAGGMFGGMIYHGHHDNGGDGGAPTFSVSLTPMQGWSLHT